MKIIPKHQEGNTVKYAKLDTYPPFSSQYMIGHSLLSLPDSLSTIRINKQLDSKGYNLFTNNCSDATRCGLETISNKKINPFLFTTPEDVKDFATTKLKAIPKYKNDSIFSPKENRYRFAKRVPKNPDRSTLYIPLDKNQYNVLANFIRNGNKNREF